MPETEPESLAGYLYDIAQNVETSIKYPGTRLDSIQLNIHSDGSMTQIKDTDESTSRPGETESGDDPTTVEFSVNQEMLTLDNKDVADQLLRIVYPVGHEPESAFPHQTTSKATFQNWAAHMLQNPSDLHTKTDLLRLHDLDETPFATIESYLADLIESEIITSNSRLAMSVEMLSKSLGVSEPLVEAALSLTTDDIVEITVDTSEPADDIDPEEQATTTDASMSDSSDMYYGHTAVFEEGETLSSNSKDVTELDREVVETVEMITVDVDEIMKAIITWVYEVPMGVNLDPQIVISAPPAKRQSGTYKEFMTGETPSNGEITIHPRHFIETPNSDTNFSDVSEALLKSGALDHPEHHEEYTYIVQQSSFVSELHLHPESKLALDTNIKYTGTDDSEYMHPEVPNEE